MKVHRGYETALAAVLGAAADAVAADDSHAAAGCIDALKQADGGQATIVLGTGPRLHKPRSGLPSGARWAVELIDAPPRLAGAMAALLSQVAVVENLAAGIELVAARLICGPSPSTTT